MSDKMYKDFENIANKSIRETIEAVIKFSDGFHGDTGIQHYLYHRVLTNSGKKIEYQYPERNNATLLFQSEVYTKLKYRNTKAGSGHGRFDMAFIEIPEHHHTKVFAKIAFEVGKNKYMGKMGQYQNSEDDITRTGDAAKIIRECRFKYLKAGYILEFYDKNRIRNAQQVRNRLQEFLTENEVRNVRVALCVLNAEKPHLWLFPGEWKDDMKMDYPDIENFSEVINEQPPNDILPATGEYYMAGEQIYENMANIQEHWVGRQGGEREIITDIKTGKWQKRKYCLNSQKPPKGRKGNWITVFRFCELVDIGRGYDP